MTKTFEEIYNIETKEFQEKKNGLTYLSWSHAWKNFKFNYPNATYEIIKFDGLPYVKDAKVGYMVYTTVTVDGLTHEMWLPVMDFKNKAMLEPSMFDINKTIMRCLTKNLAMFGLGLNIYAGEDLPEEDTEPKKTNGMKEAQQDALEEWKKEWWPREEFYKRGLDALNNSADIDSLEKSWKFIDGWRTTMKANKIITEADSKDLLQAYHQLKDDFVKAAKQ